MVHPQDSRGRPRSYASVGTRTDRGDRFGLTANDEGEVILRGLPTGTWTLDTLGSEVEVEVPTEEVVILREPPRE